MMQSAELWDRDDIAGGAGAFRRISATRSLLLQTKVRSILVIVPDVLGHEAFQMPFV